MTLDPILKPKSVAVIGASTRPNTIGSDLLKRLVDYKFTGKIYPINPRGGELYGLEVYKSVEDLPDGVDMAVVLVNSKLVPSVIDSCHAKGIKGLVVISAGFKETGAEGAAKEAEILEKVKGYGMRMVGPNCLGVVNTHPDVSLDACFAESLPRRGHIGFVSQSGALGGGILNILKDLNLGFAQFISIGNQADVDAEAAIRAWEHDEDVEQILLYMESIRSPETFREAASRVSKKKPILALKAGRSAAGASAASSHTGSLAGGDKAADALLRQSGVIREMSLQDLFRTAKAFASCPIPKGDRIAIVTNSGGPGIMATDAVSEYGMQIAQLSDETKASLRSFLPAAASVKNPVDMIASAPLEHYRNTVQTVLADPNVDMVMVIYLPFLGLKDIDVARALVEIRKEHPEKPILGVFMTESRFFHEVSDMGECGVPFFMYAEEAADAAERLNRQRKWLARPEGVVPSFEIDEKAVRDIFEAVKAEGRKELSTAESMKVLELAGVRTCRSRIAKSEEELLEAARFTGYPLVMKITSKTTSHKTDVGGVRVGIKSDEELLAAYRDVVAKLKERNLLDGLEGMIVQEMVVGKRELVAGVASDPQFGPMVMFGLGGVFVEVLEEVGFRVCPLTDVDAKELVREGKAFKLMNGARGLAKCESEKVEDILLRLSHLARCFDVKELDINPLMISDAAGEAVAVDARIEIKA